jgi:hypothetical protein
MNTQVLVVLMLFFRVALAFAVGASATFAGAVSQSGKVLVVVSSGSEINLRDGKTYPTGCFLNELTVPVMALMSAGYEITFANPKGNAPTMDAQSDTSYFFGKDEKRHL